MGNPTDYSLTFIPGGALCPAFDDSIKDLPDGERAWLESIKTTLVLNVPRFHTAEQVSRVLAGIIENGWHQQKMGSAYVEWAIGMKHDMVMALLERFNP